MGSFLDKSHPTPVELLVAVIELRKGDGITEQLPVRQDVGDIERDSAFHAIADQAKGGVLC
jgi:hypothetical protein